MISSISSVNRNVEMENRSHEPEDLSLPVGSQKSYCYARQVRVKQRKNDIKAQDSELSMSSAKNVSIIHIVVWNNVVKLRASSCKLLHVMHQILDINYVNKIATTLVIVRAFKQ